MRNKVKRIAKEIAEKIQKIEDLEAVNLSDSAEVDVYDPYFSLGIDVYYRGVLPIPPEREKLYGNIEYFDTSQYDRIDTFTCEDLSVKVEYIHADLIDRVIHELEDPAWFFKDKGSFIFFRLKHGQILWQFTDWIDAMRSRIDNLSDDFWKFLRNAAESEMRCSLTDMGAAMLKNDDLFFIDSLSRFLKSMGKVLFVVNRVLDPSPRMFNEKILSLDYLPEHFKGRYASILRQDGTIDMVQKRKIAELISKSVISMD